MWVFGDHRSAGEGREIEAPGFLKLFFFFVLWADESAVRDLFCYLLGRELDWIRT